MEEDIHKIIDDITYNIGVVSFDEYKTYILLILSYLYKRSDYCINVIDQIICSRFMEYNLNQFKFNINENSQRQRLLALLEIPKNKAQKSIEWLNYRHNHINASEASSVLGSSRQNILYHKVNPLIHNTGTSNSLAHGNTFEYISNLIHSDKIGKTIYEFESIEHPKYTFLAASPDGISSDGILIEYKNPTTRAIVGVPKDAYWVQTQIQMEVCDLERCQFVECNYNFYPNIDQLFETSHEYFGAIISYFENTNRINIYSDIKNHTYEGLNDWLYEYINNIDVDISIQYWAINTYSVFNVYRDHIWFDNALPMFYNFWNDVIFYRKNIEKLEYSPKKRAEKSKKVEIVYVDSD
jgi:putative phage-type endonuclease